MYLKSIKISGFKSFAKKTVIEFRSPVTAIVGPNGSGKSNVAEAFSFVLGEQSIKSMRGKRGEDLIWNGSQEVPRANRALVKAVFDNSGKIFNIDFDEISIERAVNRDGTNEYGINGTQVRLKDILEILAGAHIGASGHHIISQGEADRILFASANERKAMLEDALGLKVYQYKRIESERKLEKTFENTREVESLRREIAPHLRFLKKQVDKASRAFETKEKLNSFYREYLKREKIYIEGNQKALKKEKEPLQRKLAELDKLNEQAKIILENSEKRDLKSDKLLQIESELKIGREKKEGLEREAGRIEGEVAARRQTLEDALRVAKSAEHRTVRFQEVEELSREILEESITIAGESSIDVLRKIISRIRERISSFLDRNRGSSEPPMAGDLKSAIAALEKKILDIEEKIKSEEQNLEKLNASYLKIRKALEEEKNQSRLTERELFRISSERNRVESGLNMLKLKEDRLKIEEANWLREVEEAGVFLGSRATGFAGYEVKDHNGEALKEEEILKEERKFQEERRREIEKMKIRLEELGAAGGEEIMKEYRETSERDAFLERELNDLHVSSASLKGLIAELEERLNVEFKGGMEKINKAFNSLFLLMFGGGTAGLEIVESRKSGKSSKLDEENGEMSMESEKKEEVEEGIEINVSLPKKRIKGLAMLSGGERALASIALLFAISQVNPPPFVILDETDAALDEANSKKYGDLIESLAKVSQLILITHNRETMSRAGVIYGVTMGSSSVSRLLSIAFDEAVAVAK